MLEAQRQPGNSRIKCKHDSRLKALHTTEVLTSLMPVAKLHQSHISYKAPLALIDEWW